MLCVVLQSLTRLLLITKDDTEFDHEEEMRTMAILQVTAPSSPIFPFSRLLRCDILYITFGVNIFCLGKSAAIVRTRGTG
jgi:hypothetical protein